MNTIYEMALIKWFRKVAYDPVLEGARPNNVIGIGSDQDCGYRVARIDETSVEPISVHPRHIDVSDQAGGFAKTRRGKEIGCGREDLDGVAKRPHKPPHGFAKGLIVVNDRDQ